MLSLPPNLRCAVILSRIPKRYNPERSEGSAFALGIPKSAILPRRPPTISDPEPARIPRLQSAVILNAVKDLRLPLGLPSGVTSELPTIQPQCRVQDHHPLPQSSVILNAVKDLRLPWGLPSGVTSELPTIQPQCRVQDHHPLPQSSVILNAVKDLRLLLASQNPR